MRALVELARAAYGGGEVRYGDGTEGPHEAGRLALDVTKARESARRQTTLDAGPSCYHRRWHGIGRSARARTRGHCATRRLPLTRHRV